MKELLGLVTLFLVPCFPTMAQGTPAGEVGAGYTFRSYGRPAIQQPPWRLGMNGWNATVDYNLSLWLGVRWTWIGRPTPRGGPKSIIFAITN